MATEETIELIAIDLLDCDLHINQKRWSDLDEQTQSHYRTHASRVIASYEKYSASTRLTSGRDWFWMLP